MLATSSPFPQYFDKNGTPLDSGYIYFGTAGANPETSPVTVYWDSAGTQPAAQPIRTKNGFAVRNGTPAAVYGSGDYSMTVRDKRKAFVFYAQSSASAGGAASLALDLADTASASKGAGMSGFNVLLSYAAGTVGAALKSLFSTVAALPWVNLTGTPTTKAGYGLTDVVAYSDLVTHRNRLINGNFAIKQDGTYASGAAVPAGSYIHDQWKAGAGGGTATWSSSGLDTTLTISAGTFRQIVEGAFVEGGTYTLSWTGTAQARVDGGAYAASPITVTGKTAGTDISIEFGTGTVTRTQFEPGTNATGFERRSDELQRCQRYYWVLGHNITISGYANGAGQSYYNNVQFPVTMRAAPTMSVTFTGPANIAVQNIAAVGVDGFNIFIQSGASGGTASTYASGNTANARL